MCGTVQPETFWVVVGLHQREGKGGRDDDLHDTAEEGDG